MGLHILLFHLALAAVVTPIAQGAFKLGNQGFTMSQVSSMKLEVWKAAEADGGVLAAVSTHSRNSTLNNPQNCIGGSVTVAGEAFPCEGVDFLSFLGLRDLEITSATFPTGSSQASDIWGWLSPTGREITIECLDNGVVLIDSTDPVQPIILAKIETGKNRAAWCDVKVFQDVLYIVKDQVGGDVVGQTTYGVEVFNLTRIAGFESRGDLPIEMVPDFVYANHGRAHNIAINPDTGFLYSVGTSTCQGGLHMMDLNTNPLVPEFAGCVSGDGYTHDAQCVVYDGPDTRYTGNEICFAYNEDTLTIWDVTVKSSPVMLSRTCYDEATYTHQGWVTDDFRFILLDDELDEVCSAGCFSSRTTRTRTTTYYFNITDLRSPIPSGLYTHADASIDHNLYVWGSVLKRGWTGSAPVANHPSVSYAYLANYVSGLRVLDISRLGDNKVDEAGFFDVSPDLTGTTFFGAWSTYMHPSGVIAVSTIERGVFFLNFTNAYVEPNLPDIAAFSGDISKCANSQQGGLLIPVLIAAGCGVGILTAMALYYVHYVKDAGGRPPAVLDANQKL